MARCLRPRPEHGAQIEQVTGPAAPSQAVNAWFAMGLWKERFKTRHLRIRQPEKNGHDHCSFLNP